MVTQTVAQHSYNPLKTVDQSEICAVNVCPFKRPPCREINPDVGWAFLVYCPLLFMCGVGSVGPVGSETEGQGSLFRPPGQKFKIIKV